MKIILIGASGQLGGDVADVLKEERPVLLDEHDLDIADADQVGRILRDIRPEVVINTAAFHNVPLCEKEFARAFEVNAIGARNVAIACRKSDARLLHVSTDYVFDGMKKSPYVETDLPAPQSVYAATKLAGEHLVAAELPEHWIVRSSGLYGRNPCLGKGGANFVRTMLQLSGEKDSIPVVADERLTPTYTRDLARQIAELIRHDSFGVFHATNEGDSSWYEFAVEILRLAGRKTKVTPITADRFGAEVRRPSYSVLENARLKAEGIHRMRPWREALRDYLTEIGEIQTHA
jgi:dTDP-4-dehydrorhamnose reductase